MTTIDDFIKELKSISKEKRKLPLVITTPNGLMVDPKIKMKFRNDIPITFDKESVLEKMVMANNSVAMGSGALRR